MASVTILYLALSRAGWSFSEIPWLWMFAFLFAIDCRLTWFFWPF